MIQTKLPILLEREFKPGEIIVNEILGRMEVLETDYHPFKESYLKVRLIDSVALPIPEDWVEVKFQFGYNPAQKIYSALIKAEMRKRAHLEADLEEVSICTSCQEGKCEDCLKPCSCEHKPAG